jgi:hypothetical protein
VALVPPSSHPSPAVDPLAVALGYVSWNTSPAAFGNATAWTSQTPIAAAVFIPPGQTVTGIALSLTVAAAGTAPTGFFVALTSPTKMLAQSANLAASAALTATGTQQFALSATYQANAADSPTGLYYVYGLLNGAFSVTQPTFARGTGVGNSGRPLAGQNPLWGVAGAGVATPPANGAAVTVTFASIAYWVGVY